MKIVFMGTPDFAVSSLKNLINAGYDVVGVFTQPDKPVGRKRILTPPPVKVEALTHNIEVFQPKNMKDGTAVDILQRLQPDLIVVVAFGKILPQEVLDFPKYGCINVHGSLLPMYRGAAPIQWSIIDGCKKTGVTTMQLDAGIDTGDMLLKSEIEIGENETADELSERLSTLGGSLLIETLRSLEAGTLKPVKQEGKTCYAKQLDKSLSAIDWTKSAKEIHNQIRGLYSWPGTYCMLHGKKLKIHSARLVENITGNPGEVCNDNDLIVACGDNNGVRLIEIQFEGSKRMLTKDFLRGHPVEKGTSLS